MIAMIKGPQALLLIGVVLLNIGVGMAWISVRRILLFRRGSDSIRHRNKPVIANEYIKVASGIILIFFGLYMIQSMLRM